LLLTQKMSKAERAAALAALKAAKSGGAKLSHTVKDDDVGLYRDVTEDEYRSLVAKRREGDDFVEDDSACVKMIGCLARAHALLAVFICRWSWIRG
jgi:hypothetical protein